MCPLHCIVKMEAHSSMLQILASNDYTFNYHDSIHCTATVIQKLGAGYGIWTLQLGIILSFIV